MTIYNNKKEYALDEYDVEAKISNNGELEEYRRQTEYTPEYVSAAQGKVYIDGLLLDECYDIQYTYRELKEPIYGYNSKRFDAVLPGTIIIQGAFTINYKHDAYLIKALYLAKKNGQRVSVKDAINRKEATKKKQALYKQTLIELSSFQKQKKEKLTEIYNLQKELTEKIRKQDTLLLEKSSKTGNEGLLYEQLKQKELEFVDLQATLTPDQKESLKLSLQQIQTLKSSFNTSESILAENINLANTSLKELENKANKLQSEIVKSKEYIASIESKSSKTLQDNELLLFYKEQKTQLQKEMDLLQKQISETKKTISSLNSQLINNKKQFENQLAAANKKDEVVKSYLALQQEIQVIKTNIVNINSVIDNQSKSLSVDIDSYRNKINAIRTLVEELKQREDTIMKSIISLKGEINLINREIVGYLDSDAYVMNSIKKRAEDYDFFNLYLEYNGATHKVLTNCTITGHSHVLGQSGEPVKEYYTFFARDINPV